MSWDSYIDNLIAQTKDSAGATHCDKACIIGIDGGGKWTTDAHANAFKVNYFPYFALSICSLVSTYTHFMFIVLLTKTHTSNMLSYLQ